MCLKTNNNVRFKPRDRLRQCSHCDRWGLTELGELASATVVSYMAVHDLVIYCELVADADTAIVNSAAVIVLGDSSSSEDETDDTDCEQSSSDATVIISSSDEEDENKDCHKNVPVNCVTNKGLPQSSVQKSKSHCDCVAASSSGTKCECSVLCHNKIQIAEHEMSKNGEASTISSGRSFSNKVEEDIDITLIKIETNKNYTRWGRLAARVASEAPEKIQPENFIPFISDGASQAERKEKNAELKPVEDFVESSSDVFKSALVSSDKGMRNSSHYSMNVIESRCDIDQKSIQNGEFFQGHDIDERKVRTWGISNRGTHNTSDVDERHYLDRENKSSIKFFNSADIDERNSSSAGLHDIDERDITKFTENRQSISNCSSGIRLGGSARPTEAPTPPQISDIPHLQTYDSGNTPHSSLASNILSASLSTDKLDDRNIITPPLVFPEMGTISFQSENSSTSVSHHSYYSRKSTSQLKHYRGNNSLRSPTRILDTDACKPLQMVNPPFLEKLFSLRTDERQGSSLLNRDWDERILGKVLNGNFANFDKNQLSIEPTCSEGPFRCSTASNITTEKEINLENSVRPSMINRASKLSAGVQENASSSVSAYKSSINMQMSTHIANTIKPSQSNRPMASSIYQTSIASNSLSGQTEVKSSSPVINGCDVQEPEICDKSDEGNRQTTKAPFTYSCTQYPVQDTNVQLDMASNMGGSESFLSTKPSRTYSRTNSKSPCKAVFNYLSDLPSRTYTDNANSVLTGCQSSGNNLHAKDDILVPCSVLQKSKLSSNYLSRRGSDAEHEVGTSLVNMYDASMKSGIHTYSRRRPSLSNSPSNKKNKHVSENAPRPSRSFEPQKVTDITSLKLQNDDGAISQKSLPTKTMSKYANTTSHKLIQSGARNNNVSVASRISSPDKLCHGKVIANQTQERTIPEFSEQSFDKRSLRKSSPIKVQQLVEFTSETNADVQSVTSGVNKCKSRSKPTAAHSFDTSCTIPNSRDSFNTELTQPLSVTEHTVCTTASTVERGSPVASQPLLTTSVELRTGVCDMAVKQNRKESFLDPLGPANNVLQAKTGKVADTNSLGSGKSTDELFSQFQSVHSKESTVLNQSLLNSLKVSSSVTISSTRSIKMKDDKHIPKPNVSSSSNMHNTPHLLLSSGSSLSLTTQSTKKISKSPSRESKTTFPRKPELISADEDLTPHKQSDDVYEYRHSPSPCGDLKHYQSLASFRQSKMLSSQERRKSLQDNEYTLKEKQERTSNQVQEQLNKKTEIQAEFLVKNLDSISEIASPKQQQMEGTQNQQSFVSFTCEDVQSSHVNRNESVRKFHSQQSCDVNSSKCDKKNGYSNSRNLEENIASTVKSSGQTKYGAFSEKLNIPKITQPSLGSDDLVYSNSSKCVKSVRLQPNLLSSDKDSLHVGCKDRLRTANKTKKDSFQQSPVISPSCSVQVNRQDIIETNTTANFNSTSTPDINLSTDIQGTVSSSISNNFSVSSKHGSKLCCPVSQLPVIDESGLLKPYSNQPLPLLANIRLSNDSSDDASVSSKSTMSNGSYDSSKYKISVADSLVTLSANESVVVDGNTVSIDDVVRFCDGELGGFGNVASGVVLSDFMKSSSQEENQVQESARNPDDRNFKSNEDAVDRKYKASDLSTDRLEEAVNASERATAHSVSMEQHTPIHCSSPSHVNSDSASGQDLKYAQDKENFDPTLEECPGGLHRSHLLSDGFRHQTARSGSCPVQSVNEDLAEDTLRSSLPSEEEEGDTPVCVPSPTSTLSPKSAPLPQMRHLRPTFPSVVPQQEDAGLAPLLQYDGALMYCDGAVATLPARSRPDGYVVYHVFERQVEGGGSVTTFPSLQQVINSDKPLETLFHAVLNDLACEGSSHGHRGDNACIGDRPVGLEAVGGFSSACSSCKMPVGAMASDLSTTCDNIEEDEAITQESSVVTSNSRSEDSSSESRSFDSLSDSDMSDTESIFDWSCDEFGPTLLGDEIEISAGMSNSREDAAKNSDLDDKKISAYREHVQEPKTTVALVEYKDPYKDFGSVLSVGEDLPSVLQKEEESVDCFNCQPNAAENATLEQDPQNIALPVEFYNYPTGHLAGATYDLPGQEFDHATCFKTDPSLEDEALLPREENSSDEAQNKSVSETCHQSLRYSKREKSFVGHEEASTAGLSSVPDPQASQQIIEHSDYKKNSDDDLPSVPTPKVSHEYGLDGGDGLSNGQLSPTSCSNAYNEGEMRREYACHPAFFRLPASAAAADPSTLHLYRVYELGLQFPSGGCRSLQWRRALRRLRRIPSLVSVTPDEENKKLMVAVHIRSIAPASTEIRSCGHNLEDMSHKQPSVAPAENGRKLSSVSEDVTAATDDVVENFEKHEPPDFDDEKGECVVKEVMGVTDRAMRHSKHPLESPNKELIPENRTKPSRRTLVDRDQNRNIYAIEEEGRSCNISKFASARERWQELPPVSRILRILRKLDSYVTVTDAESMEVDGMGDLVSSPSHLCFPDSPTKIRKAKSGVKESNDRLGTVRAETVDNSDFIHRTSVPDYTVSLDGAASRDGTVAAVEFQHCDGIYCLCDCIDCREEEFKNETDDFGPCFCSVSQAWLFENRLAHHGTVDYVIHGLGSDELQCGREKQRNDGLDLNKTRESKTISHNLEFEKPSSEISKSENADRETSNFRTMSRKKVESKNLNGNNSRSKNINSELSNLRVNNCEGEKLCQDSDNGEHLISETSMTNSLNKDKSGDIYNSSSKPNAGKEKSLIQATIGKTENRLRNANRLSKAKLSKFKKIIPVNPLEMQVLKKKSSKQTPANASTNYSIMIMESEGSTNKSSSQHLPGSSSSVPSSISFDNLLSANFRDLKLSKACQSLRCIYKKKGVLENFQEGDSLPLFWCSDNHRIVAKGAEASAFVQKIMAGDQRSLEQLCLSNSIESTEQLDLSQTHSSNSMCNRSRGVCGSNFPDHRVSVDDHDAGGGGKSSSKELVPLPKKSKLKMRRTEVRTPAKRKDKNETLGPNQKLKGKYSSRSISNISENARHIKNRQKSRTKTLKHKFFRSASSNAKIQPAKATASTKMNSRDQFHVKFESLEDLFSKSRQILSGCPVFPSSRDSSSESRVWLDPAFYDSPLSVPLLRRCPSPACAAANEFRSCRNSEFTSDCDGAFSTAAYARGNVDSALETSDSKSTSTSEVRQSASKPVIRDRNKHVLKVELKNCMFSSSAINKRKLKKDFSSSVQRQASLSRCIKKHLDDPRRKLKYCLPSSFSSIGRLSYRNRMIKKFMSHRRLVSKPRFVSTVRCSVRHMPLGCHPVRLPGNASDASAGCLAKPKRRFSETQQRQLSDALSSVCDIFDDLLPREAPLPASTVSSLPTLVVAREINDMSEDSIDMPSITKNSSENSRNDSPLSEANETCRVNESGIKGARDDKKNSKKNQSNSMTVNTFNIEATQCRKVQKIIENRIKSNQSNDVPVKKKRKSVSVSKSVQILQSRQKLNSKRSTEASKSAKKLVSIINSKKKSKNDSESCQLPNESEKVRIDVLSDLSSDSSSEDSDNSTEDDLRDPAWVPGDESEHEDVEETDMIVEQPVNRVKYSWKFFSEKKKKVNILGFGLNNGKASNVDFFDECSEIKQLVEQSKRITTTSCDDYASSKGKFRDSPPNKSRRIYCSGPASSKVRGSSARIDVDRRSYERIDKRDDPLSDDFSLPVANGEIIQQITGNFESNSGYVSVASSRAAVFPDESNRLIKCSSICESGDSAQASTSYCQSSLLSQSKPVISDPIAESPSEPFEEQSTTDIADASASKGTDNFERNAAANGEKTCSERTPTSATVTRFSKKYVAQKIPKQEPVKNKDLSDSNREKYKPKSFVDSFFQFIAKSFEGAAPKRESDEEQLCECEKTTPDITTGVSQRDPLAGGISAAAWSEQNHSLLMSPLHDDDDVAVLLDDNAVDPLFVDESDFVVRAANNEAPLEIPSSAKCFLVTEEASSTNEDASKLRDVSLSKDNQFCQSTHDKEVQSTARTPVALVPKLFRHILLPRGRSVSDSTEGKPLVDPTHKVLVESNQVATYRQRGRCRPLLSRNRTVGENSKDNSGKLTGPATASSGRNCARRGRPSLPSKSSSRGRAGSSLRFGRVKLKVPKVKLTLLDKSDFFKVLSDSCTSFDNSCDSLFVSSNEGKPKILDSKLRLRPMVRLERIDQLVPIKRKLNSSDERGEIEQKDETFLPKCKKFCHSGRRNSGRHFRFKERTADHITVST
ncbi:hypothetical protein FHG87_017953 [Trinorchestia longiramus]|nr:hypothetical protein FHG87_017953 [Trinorchestia longiramus]